MITLLQKIIGKLNSLYAVIAVVGYVVVSIFMLLSKKYISIDFGITFGVIGAFIVATSKLANESQLNYKYILCLIGGIVAAILICI